MKQCGDAKRPIGRVDGAVAGHRNAGARGRNRLFARQRPVAVDDQAGIGARNHRRIEMLGEPLRHFSGTRVPGDMGRELSGVQTQSAQPARNAVRGMIADDDGIAATLCVHNI